MNLFNGVLQPDLEQLSCLEAMGDFVFLFHVYFGESMLRLVLGKPTYYGIILPTLGLDTRISNHGLRASKCAVVVNGNNMCLYQTLLTLLAVQSGPAVTLETNIQYKKG